MLQATRVTAQNAARIIPSELLGTPQVPIRYAPFETNTSGVVTSTEFTDSTTAFVGAEYFNAPALVAVGNQLGLAGAATSGIAVVQLDQYNHLRVAPLLRHASAVSNATCRLYKWLLWMGTRNGVPFVRGEYRGYYDLVAGSKVLPSTDPLYLSTAQTAHCDTITPVLDGAPLGTPSVTGGATPAQQRCSFTVDQEGAFAVAFQAVNGSGVSTALELMHL